jgi:hypothetical protein
VIYRFPVRIVALIAVLGTYGWARPAHAEHIQVFANQGATISVSSMGTAYGVSPSLSVGILIPTEDVNFRVSTQYTALRAVRDTLPTVVHHGAMLCDVVVPKALGSDRFYVAAGLGVGVRRLAEGRLLRNERKVDAPATALGYYIVADTVGAGFNEPVGDLVGRIGMGVHLLRSARWNAAVEIRYQAAFGIGNPPGVSLDQRAEETIQIGFVVGWAVPRRGRP